MSASRRDSDSKRYTSSKYDREPSPKRSRGNGRRDDGDARRGRDYDQKRQLPGEAISSKAEDIVPSKGSDKKTDPMKNSEKKEHGRQIEKKHSPKPASLPRSNSHVQEDDRGNTRRSDRNSNQRSSSDRVWGRDSRDQLRDRDASRFKDHLRDDRAAHRENKDRTWRHDGFFELEANPSQPASRKRPAFSEQKIAAEDVKSELANKNERDERGSRIPHRLERDRRVRRPFNGDRGEQRDFNLSSRDRFDGRSGTYGRQGPQATSTSDKWKHDMFTDSNRSPTPKNEEDQIAKVEALLAS